MSNLIILVISPHSDDMALSISGILDALRGKAAIHALTIFSESDWLHPSLKHHVQVADLRRAEDKAFCNAMDMGYSSGHFPDAARRGVPPDGLNIGVEMQFAGESALVNKVSAFIKEKIDFHKPNLILCPAAVGNHIDHIITRHASIAAAHGANIDLFVYEDLPYRYHALPGDFEMLTAAAGATGTVYRKSLNPWAYLRKISTFGYYRSQLLWRSQIGFIARALLYEGHIRNISERMRAYTDTPLSLEAAEIMGLKR